MFAPAGRIQNFGFWSNFGPNLPHEGVEFEKSKYFQGKNLSIGLHEYPKIRALSALNFELKIQLLFAVLGVFWGKKGPKSQRSRGQRSG